MPYDYRPAEELNNDELIARLTEKYKPSEIPPCRFCGGKLSIGSIGGGKPTVWACSTMEDDPDKPGYLRVKVDRQRIDDHYSQSRYEDRRQGGDSDVMELIKRFK